MYSSFLLYYLRVGSSSLIMMTGGTGQIIVDTSLNKYYNFNRIYSSYFIIIINGGNLMNVNTKTLVSITEANQNFSKVARLVDENGSAVILKNNVPRYLIVEFSQAKEEQKASNEDVLEISKRLITKNKTAYEVLAK